MILTVGGEKGGPGKSTVATTMAAMRASTGRQVLLVNADAQSTSIHWATARRDHPDMPQVTTVTMRGPKIHTEIADMAKRFEDVVIDTGGHDCVELRSALIASDRLLMPLRPSQPDIWTLEKMAEIIGHVSTVNERLQCFVFVNQVPSTSRDRLRQAMVEVMESWPQFQLLKTAWMFRAAFAGAIGEGLTVHEMKPRDGKAAAEASFLYGEVFA
jgi:chromosome partitioning protein